MSCKGCVYAIRLSGEWYCDYLNVTRRRRPSQPGEACTVRIKAGKDPKQAWKERLPMKERSWDTEKARTLYEQGLSDRKIAMEVGTTAGAVGFWRRKLGLPANQEHRAAPEAPPPKESPPEAPPETSSQAPPVSERPLSLPKVKGPIELSVEIKNCAFAVRAPDLEGLAWIYEYAGKLLRKMTAEVEGGGCA